MDNAQTKVVDLQDEVERLDGEIEDLMDEAEDLDEEEDSDEYEEKEIQFKAFNVQKQNFEEIIDERGSKFEIRELSFGEISHIRDTVLAQSDGDNVREGLYRVKVLETGVTDSPVGFDDDPKQWKPLVAEHIYGEIDALNSGVDEESISNFSLSEELENRQ